MRWGVQTACMALFNAIVNSPDDLEFRMHLRNELFVMGIDALIDVRPARALLRHPALF